MSRPLTPETIRLEKAVLELKHPHAYLLWDKAGSMWRTISRRIPGVEPLEAGPNLTRFRYPPNDEFSIDLEGHRMVAASPEKKLLEFRERAEVFSRAVSDTLEIAQFTRLGLRLIYAVPATSREEAAAMVLSKGILRPPTSLDDRPPFAGKAVLPEIGFRWEGKAIGISYRLRAETRNYELTIPPEFPREFNLASTKREMHYAAFDLDYYTTVSIPRGQLVLSDWLESAIRVLKRETDRILGESGND
jgi:hypothetical protein